MADFRKLTVWQRSHAMTLDIYKVTRSFPREELYGLTRQIRTASASIPMNIAEGCGRKTQTDRARFIDFASGSAAELDYQLELARDLGYLREPHYSRLAKEVDAVKRMLAAFGQALRDNP